MEHGVCREVDGGEARVVVYGEIPKRGCAAREVELLDVASRDLEGAEFVGAVLLVAAESELLELAACHDADVCYLGIISKVYLRDVATVDMELLERGKLSRVEVCYVETLNPEGLEVGEEV